MEMFCPRFAFLTFSVILILDTVLPQQYVDPSLENIVNTAFGKLYNPVKRPTRKRRSGFGVVVTPVPVDESETLEMFSSISGRSQCNCVPYYQCVPNTQTFASFDDGIFDTFGLIDTRFNKDTDDNAPSCEHFLDVCCDEDRTRNISLTPTPQEQRPNRPKGCGVRNVGGIDFSITGANDNEAGFGEFPWTVALLHSLNSLYFCAGSLIHPRVTLTAAHCVVNRSLNSFIIRAGEWDTQTIKERLPFEERDIIKVVTHPHYNYHNVANDFALVILKTSFTLGDHINVVCLPPHNSLPLPHTTCYSTGWGKDEFGAAGCYSAIMKRVLLPIVSYKNCQKQLRKTRLGSRFALDKSFICAGGQVGIDVCQGDGGAPLVCPIGLESNQRYQQYGIVSWGIGCNDEIPAVYANVALARDWIDNQMYANGFDTTAYSLN